MIAQLTGFVVGSLCFIIIGSIVKKLADWNLSCFHDFLIGLALSNAVFTVISLGFPINNTVAFLFLVSVIVLLLANVNYERIYFHQLIRQFTIRSQKEPVLFCLLGVFIVLTFFQSLYSPSLHYDSGLYHVPSIKWTAEHKTIRGLVHLNYFLGYNFNIFSLDAAFYNVFQQPIYPINVTVVCFFLVWIASRISCAMRSDSYVLAASYVLILYYLFVSFWPHVSTPSTDTLVYVLSLLILVSVIDLEKNKDVTFGIIILSSYAITIKLSAAPVLLVALYLFFTKYYWTHKKQVVVTSLLSSFILIPWLVKNTLLTGWLVFPFPSIDLFSFDWKLPMQDVVSLKDAIRSYYVPAEGSRVNVVNAWVFNQTGADLVIIVMSVVAVVLLLVRLLTRQISVSTDYLAAVITAIFGVVFMSINSPSLRYGVAFFSAAILLSVHALQFKDTSSQYGFYVASLLVVVSFLTENWFHPWHFTKHIAQRIWLPYPLVLTEPKRFAYFLLDKQTKCYYPLESNQCFDHSLPCASKKITGLHLRGNEIDQGFYRDAR